MTRPGIRSLRARFVVVFFGLVLLLTSVGLSTLDYAIDRNARGQLATELTTSERVLRRLLADRSAQLEQAATVLAADFAFRAAVATGDRETVVSALENHGERIGAALMMMLDREARVTASTAGVLAPGMPFPQTALFARATSGEHAAGLMSVGGRLFQTVLVPVKAPQIIGWVAMSFVVDARMASELGALTSTAVAFAVDDGRRGWRYIGDAPRTQGLQHVLPESDAANASPRELGQDLLLVAALAPAPDRVLAILHVPLAQALAPYAPLQRFLLVLAVGALFASVAGSALIARSITRPLSELAGLAREFAAGDYRRAAAVARDDEVGALATALNTMRDGIASREATISDLAYRDTVTGLPNRAAFSASAAERLAGHDVASLLVIGVDNFRYVTHTLGHPFAERLLREVARRLAAAFDTELLARIGTDQFALLLCSRAVDAAQGVAAAVTQVLEAPFQVDEQCVDLGGSVGVVTWPTHGDDVTRLLQRAEIALGVARRARLDVAVYDTGFDQGPERLSLLGELRRAVESDQLVLFYQPKLDLRSGRPLYVEALLRWQHPSRGFVPPDEFIPFAEQTGYIRVITQWVLDRALRQCARWLAQGIALRMCINISARDLLDAHLPGRIEALLRELALPPAQVWLEITESAIMDDPARAQQTIAALDALGLQLSIDDYGTGYSSLAYLKRLPVDELKIDKAFVLTMDRDASDATIVRSTIELGHALGLTVVAEGVDNERALTMLADWGCDVAQGFHICRPLPPDRLEAWLVSEECRRFARPATPTRRTNIERA